MPAIHSELLAVPLPRSYGVHMVGIVGRDGCWKLRRARLQGAIVLALCGGCAGDDTGSADSVAADTTSGSQGSSTLGAEGPGTDGGQSSSDEGADETAGSSTGSETPPPPNADCDAPTPLDQPGDAASGVEACDDGLMHRAEAVDCTVPTLPEPTCGDKDACQAHSDCTDQPDGFCLDTDDATIGCECVYPACTTDADCGDDELCLCAASEADTNGLPPIPQCIASTCQIDADCGAGLCGIQSRLPECGPTTYAAACLTIESECRDPSNCGELTCELDGSAYSEACLVTDGAWSCVDPGCGPTGCG